MSRIRTIKPEFFRHEELQDLGAEAMLVFAGLWTQCDSKGRFIWKPRQLKLDILPFMKFDMETMLEKLRKSGFLLRYEVGGKSYGCVPTFRDHQRITGKEATDGEKYPDLSEDQPGNIGESSEKQPGNTQNKQDAQEKEKEKEKEKERKEYSEDFLAFFTAYPRRVAKDEAYKSWNKRNGTRPALDLILSAITKQIEWRENSNGEFRPEWKHPATWINQGCWDDEVTASGKPHKKEACEL